jgi:hypothetical protein
MVPSLLIPAPATQPIKCSKSQKNPCWAMSSGQLRGNRPSPIQHQRIRPPRTQKWERQPFRNQTDGVSVGLPSASTVTSHLGLASATTRSSMTCPQPQGQRMPTHQSSPPSRARTRSRCGMRAGKQSASTTRSRRGGDSRAHARRHHCRIPHKAITAVVPLARANPTVVRCHLVPAPDWGST